MKYILWIALLQYIPFNFNETLGNVPMHFEYYHFAATMYLSFSYKKVSLYHMPSKTCKLSLRLSLYNVYIQRPDPSPPKLRLHFVHVPMSLLCFLRVWLSKNQPHCPQANFFFPEIGSRHYGKVPRDQKTRSHPSQGPAGAKIRF